MLDSFDLSKFKQALLHVKMLEASGFSLQGKTVLEFGAGWDPTMAYVYRISGCKKVILCDQNQFLKYDVMRGALQFIKENIAIAAESLGISVGQAKSALPGTADNSFECFLNESGFEYHAPLDMRSTPFEDASIDCIASRTVLEHIPENEIEAIMRETRRIVKPSGRTIYTIDQSDHWQHCDNSISRVNYLKFSDTWWGIINSPISYQNRLRSCEFIKLMEEAGFTIGQCDEVVDEGALRDAREISLNKRWRHMSPVEVAVLTTHVVASPC